MPRPALPLALLLAACTAASVPQTAGARTLSVGEGQQYKLPSEAIARAQDGDTIAIAPGEYFDCAVVARSNLTIQGTGPGVVMTDKACAGKGILVTQGSGITVRNLTLTRARVPDQNGAGIRSEGKKLTVEGVRFINNQNGLLAAGTGDDTLTIRDSEFTGNGTCEKACAHGMYVGQYGLVRIERTKFSGTKQGHHIKSRALRTEVIDSEISDGPDGTASYLIDIPNGGSLVVRNSRFEKGPNAENHTAAIRVGAEGVTQRTDEIVVEGSSFRNDGQKTIFLDNLTATEAVMRGNTISGPVQALRGDGRVQ